ncbi:histidine acid phosphatase, partial [Ostertagia ostertagi]
MVSMSALLVLTVVVFLVHFGQSDKKATAQLVPLEANADTLVYLQVAWRHGDRTPATSVPFNDASAWEEGLGELTRKGIAQQYRLGKWLRARYGRWFGNRFDRNEVFVRSSDYNRTIMSAQANMADFLGLFPPLKMRICGRQFAVQPVPVHSVPRAIDKELYEDISCPTANEEFSTLWRSEVVKRMRLRTRISLSFSKKRREFLILSFASSGCQLSGIMLKRYLILLQLQHSDTQKWPSWVNASVFDRIQKLYDASSRMKYHTDVLRRLRGGNIIR